MKKKLIPLFLWASMKVCIGQAQTPSFISIALQPDTKTRVFPLNTGKKSGDLPIEVSLRAYCPMPQHQGKTTACTAWATVYAALTISRASQFDVTDRAILQRMSHSAHFVFNSFIDPLSKKPCETRVSLRDCLLFLQEKGACLVSTFNPTNDCLQKADSSAWEEALQFKITDFLATFRKNDDSTIKILQMRRLLAAKKPVVIALSINSPSLNLSQGTVLEQVQKEGTTVAGHAVVIVGYNEAEQSFEFMNSWGSDWGNGGFGKISYSDFIQHTEQTYCLEL